MVRLTDRPAMTIAVDLGRKATKPTNNQLLLLSLLLQLRLLQGMYNVASYGSPGGTFLLITYHLLLTTYTYHLLLITYYLLLTTYHLLLTTYYLSFHI